MDEVPAPPAERVQRLPELSERTVVITRREIFSRTEEVEIDGEVVEVEARRDTRAGLRVELRYAGVSFHLADPHGVARGPRESEQLDEALGEQFLTLTEKQRQVLRAVWGWMKVRHG
jgi:hypothetical protein